MTCQVPATGEANHTEPLDFRHDSADTSVMTANIPKLTPAAWKWLHAAAAQETVHPTWGPYSQLIAAGLATGPQEAMRITDIGIVLARVHARETLQQAANA